MNEWLPEISFQWSHLFILLRYVTFWCWTIWHRSIFISGSFDIGRDIETPNALTVKTFWHRNIITPEHIDTRYFDIETFWNLIFWHCDNCTLEHFDLEAFLNRTVWHWGNFDTEHFDTEELCTETFWHWGTLTLEQLYFGTFWRWTILTPDISTLGQFYIGTFWHWGILAQNILTSRHNDSRYVDIYFNNVSFFFFLQRDILS